MRSVSIHVVHDKLVTESLCNGLGLVHPYLERVGQQLQPLFPGMDVCFMRTDSRTPKLVAAVIHTESTEVLFLFRIFRGALGSAKIPEELRRSMAIEVL